MVVTWTASSSPFLLFLFRSVFFWCRPIGRRFVCVCVCVCWRPRFVSVSKQTSVFGFGLVFFFSFFFESCGMKIKFETTKKIFHSAATAAAGNSLRFPIRLMENVRHGNRSWPTASCAGFVRRYFLLFFVVFFWVGGLVWFLGCSLPRFVSQSSTKSQKHPVNTHPISVNLNRIKVKPLPTWMASKIQFQTRFNKAKPSKNQ